MTSEHKEAAKQRFKKLDERDADIYAVRKAKNDFEDMIYKSREWVNEDKNKPFFDQSQLENFLANLTAHEEWLYEDGYDTPKEVYIDKI